MSFKCKLGLHTKETVYEDDYLRHEHCVKCDKHRLLSRSPRFGIDGAIAEGAMRGVYTGLNGWENLSRAMGACK